MQSSSISIDAHTTSTKELVAFMKDEFEASYSGKKIDPRFELALKEVTLNQQTSSGKKRKRAANKENSGDRKTPITLKSPDLKSFGSASSEKARSIEKVVPQPI